MSIQRRYDPTQKDQVINTLRREILAARLKVTLDRKLGETTSDLVKKLAGMDLPLSVPVGAEAPAQQQDGPERPPSLGIPGISPGWTAFQDPRRSSDPVDDLDVVVGTFVRVSKEDAGKSPIEALVQPFRTQRE